MSLDEYANSLPPGSTQINFVLTGASLPLPSNFNRQFGSDVALNIAFMLELSEDETEALTLFIDVSSVSGCLDNVTSRRRLLGYTSHPLTLVSFIKGNVVDAIPALAQVLNDTSNGTDSSIAGRLAQLVQQVVENGTFVTPNAGVNATQSSVGPLEMSAPSSTGITQFEKSSDMSAGAIAGAVIGSVIGLIWLCAFAYVVNRKWSNLSRPPTEAVMPAVAGEDNSKLSMNDKNGVEAIELQV